MADVYDPTEYWTNAPAMTIQPAHAKQEIALMRALDDIEPTSILEIGVGFGRIGKLLCERWPDAMYTGVDISADRIAEARTNLPGRARLVQADFLDWDGPQYWCDLVVAVEVLMHVRPSDLPNAVERLKAWSRWRVLTCDWTKPVDGPIADWNFRHNYTAYKFEAVEAVGKQTIYRHDWW